MDAQGLARVNHVFCEIASLHIQGTDAHIHAGDACGLQGRDGDGEDLGIRGSRVGLAGNQSIFDAAVDINVHVLS